MLSHLKKLFFFLWCKVARRVRHFSCHLVKRFLRTSLERSMSLVDCLMPKVFDLVDVPNVTASAFILILCDKSKTLIFNKQF